MKKLLLLVLTFTTLSLPGIASARTTIYIGHNPFANYKNTGIFYIGIGSGSAKAADPTFFSGEQSQSASMGFFGLKLGPYIGIELGSLYFAKEQDNGDDPTTADSQPGTVVNGSFQSLLVRLPLDNFSIYGRVSSLDYNITVDGVDLYEEDQNTTGVGYGVEWFANEWFSFRLEAEKYKEMGPSKTDITFSRFGFNFHF